MDNLLLPIGSVVKLRKGNQLLMIEGYLTNDTSNPNKFYDYVACEYPYGLRTDKIIMFYHKDIDEVVFIGYQTDGAINFRKEITAIKEKMDNNIPYQQAVEEIKKEGNN